MDGSTFYSHFRAHYGATGARVPVLLMSAGRSVRDHARMLGADGHLAKPFDFDALLSELERHTARG